MNLYAEVIVDCQTKESLSITADENLQDLIDTEVLDGHLKLTQKEWISSSQKIIIRIGAPQLKRIESSVHETILVKNLNRDEFQARALIGKLILEGKVDELSLGVEIGQIDAKAVEAPYVNVNLWSHGLIEPANPNRIEGIVEKDGRIYYNGPQTKVSVKTKSGGSVHNKAQVAKNEEN